MLHRDLGKVVYSMLTHGASCTLCFCRSRYVRSVFMFASLLYIVYDIGLNLTCCALTLLCVSLERGGTVIHRLDRQTSGQPFAA